MYIHEPMEEMWLGGIAYFPTNVVQITLGMIIQHVTTGITNVEFHVISSCFIIFQNFFNSV